MLKRLTFMAIVALALLPVSSCYNPDLNEFPFVCGGKPGHGVCPDGYSCYGGHCLEQAPACWQTPYFTMESGGDDDADKEPNNVPSQAVLLPCGELNYEASCPKKYTAEQEFQLTKLAICPPGDYDIYRFYLNGCDSIEVSLLLAVDPRQQTGRDLHMKIFRMVPDENGNERPQVVIQQESSNLQEKTIKYTIPSGQGGWYYLQIYGASVDPETGDINGYQLKYSFTKGEVGASGECLTEVAQ